MRFAILHLKGGKTVVHGFQASLFAPPAPQHYFKKSEFIFQVSNPVGSKQCRPFNSLSSRVDDPILSVFLNQQHPPLLRWRTEFPCPQPDTHLRRSAWAPRARLSSWEYRGL